WSVVTPLSGGMASHASIWPGGMVWPGAATWPGTTGSSSPMRGVWARPADGSEKVTIRAPAACSSARRDRPALHSAPLHHPPPSPLCSSGRRDRPALNSARFTYPLASPLAAARRSIEAPGEDVRGRQLEDDRIRLAQRRVGGVLRVLPIKGAAGAR